VKITFCFPPLKFQGNLDVNILPLEPPGTMFFLHLGRIEIAEGKDVPALRSPDAIRCHTRYRRILEHTPAGTALRHGRHECAGAYRQTVVQATTGRRFGHVSGYNPENPGF
jgi:hypothetical protein